MNTNGGSAGCNGGAVAKKATISLGSRKYGWRLSRLRGRDGAAVWFGWGILTSNLDRLVVRERAHA